MAVCFSKLLLHHPDLLPNPRLSNTTRLCSTSVRPNKIVCPLSNLPAPPPHPLPLLTPNVLLYSRMQVLKSRTPMFSSLYGFAMRDGIPSLWSGLSASILRQSTYSTARFGLYDFFSRKFHGSGTKPTTTSTIVCAGVAGGLAGMIGNPAEVVLVRMCADGAKPPGEQFRYPNALVGLIRIWRDEGVMVFGRGLSANVVRSVLMSKSPSSLSLSLFGPRLAYYIIQMSLR
jgi:hypothetical protein